MTSYESMSAGELRDERNYWLRQVCLYAREYRSASLSGDIAWSSGVGVALDQALAQVKKLDRMLALGVAA